MKVITLLIIIILPGFLQAQYGETLSTDRPGQALGTSSVGSKVIQVQTGINSNFIGYDDDHSSTTVLSNTVIRVGLFERLEVNGLINWQSDRMKIQDETETTSGISDTEIGARLNILENFGTIPAIGLQGSLLLKAQSPEYVRDKMGSRIVLTTGNQINDWLSVATNLGVGWDGNGGNAQSIYVLNFAFGLTDKLGAVAEVYGTFSTFDANYDLGIAYLLTPDFQLDLTAGWQGDSQVSDWFIDAGLSFRLDWRRTDQLEGSQ